jgi:hypothetical protein
VVDCLIHSLSQEISSHSPTYQVGYTPAIRTNLTLTPPSTRFTHTSQLSLRPTILRKLVFNTLSFPRPEKRQKMDRRARANLPTPPGWVRPNSGREPEAIEDDSSTSLFLPRRARANLPTASGWLGPNSGREPEAFEDDSSTSLLLPRRARTNFPTPSSWVRPNSGREPEAIEDDSGTSLLLPLLLVTLFYRV